VAKTHGHGPPFHTILHKKLFIMLLLQYGVGPLEIQTIVSTSRNLPHVFHTVCPISLKQVSQAQITHKLNKASLNREFHRPGFQDVKLWYEIDVSLNV
jgi:hypothetical protein